MADPKIIDGKLVSDQVTDKIFSEIEKGALTKIDAIVVHQTGGKTSQSSFNSYKGGQNGAHFLIDRDGTTYQTAHVTKTCWHVGRIQSRCYKLNTCSSDELKEIKGLLFNKADSYAARINKLNDHESSKGYPDRFPNNSDSIGIELVAGFSDATGYDAATDEQNAALKWLVSTLETLLSLTDGDIFRHPDVSYKQSSEASSAKW
jgi:N-acetyl-anhydromuramyl-L-alanine amidase AmpD